jgi:rubredoxin
MAVKYYKLYCEMCGYNLITDGSNITLTEYKRSKIQKELPKLDPSTNKLAPATWITLPKKYKCPKCGRLIAPRPFKEPNIENNTKNNYEQNFNPRSQGGFERY